MKNLSSLGLKVRRTSAGRPAGETRFEVRIAESNAFVALFHASARMSNGERVVNAATQLVHRTELTHEQVTAIQEWQKEQALIAINS